MNQNTNKVICPNANWDIYIYIYTQTHTHTQKFSQINELDIDALLVDQVCTEYHYMAIKIDMSKAYDRVEWDMIISMMERIDFNQKWKIKIKECISSVSYKVLINGSLRQEILPFRGLRQGDPISPLIFFLCAEGLS